ncbi:MAG: FecR domain-containing protein [Myxococcota bacterium]
MTAPDPVARPVDERRIARHWDGVRHRLRRLRRRRAAVVVASALLGGLVLGGVVMQQWMAGPSVVTWRELDIETGAQGGVLGLSDGSRVRLASHSRVEACDQGEPGVCIRVDRGRAHFEVSPRSGSALRVLGGPVEVRVVGTRFLVERIVAAGHQGVTVTVEEGAVRLMAPGVPDLRLESGQTWSTRVSSGAPTAAEGPQGDEEQPEERARGIAVDGAQTGVAGADPTAEEGAEPGGGPPSAPPEAAGAGKGPRALWERAMRARSLGEHRSEERAYVALLRRHPGDARARQAAFELGRLRMDALGDPAGAIAPLRRAAKAGSGATFHGDALARLARAYEATGDEDACRGARRKYLDRYPSGMHARVVRTLCMDP